MKTKQYLFLSVFLAFSAFAGQDRGGGDICENKFQSITADISSWISKSGHSSLRGVPADYSKRMLEQIKRYKVQCIGPEDKGYPVEVDGTAKVCRFDRSGNKSQVTCDLKKFMDLKDDDQYILTHHELAGLAGLESPRGDVSDYAISNQITSFLEFQMTRRLVVRGENNIDQNNDWSEIEVTAAEKIMQGIHRRVLLQSFSDCTITKSADGTGRLDFKSLIVPTLGFYQMGLERPYEIQFDNKIHALKLFKHKFSDKFRVYFKNEFYLNDKYRRVSAELVFRMDSSHTKILEVNLRPLPAVQLYETGDIYNETFEERPIVVPGLELFGFSCNGLK
jgi:hypothetical protein